MTLATFVVVTLIAVVLSYTASWVMWRASHSSGLMNLFVGALLSLVVLAGAVGIGYLIATLSR